MKYFLSHTLETLSFFHICVNNQLAFVRFFIKVFLIYYRSVIFRFMNRMVRDEKSFEKSTLICDIEFDKQNSASDCMLRKIFFGANQLRASCVFILCCRADGFTFSKLFAPFSHDYYAELVKRV